MKDKYFQWMYDQMCEGKTAPEITWYKLFKKLDSVLFTITYKFKRDKNRLEDGLDLRHRFDPDYTPDELNRDPSVLEVMIALAFRIEETIMDNPEAGDRTAQWFWGMVTNMGLGGMFDDNYSEEYVDWAITRMLERKYEPDGKGGLFRVRNNPRDLRKVEIWDQALWYLDTMS